jgi:putative methionine-R-sulfoxide reductase with GAF domain
MPDRPTATDLQESARQQRVRQTKALLSKRPVLFAVSVGGVLVLLWFAAVLKAQLSGNPASIMEWPGASFIFLGLFPVALVMLCGYLILQLKRLLTVGHELGHNPSDQRYYDLLLIVRRINRTWGRENNVQAVLDEITQACLEAFHCQQVSLMLMDDTRQDLIVRSAAGNGSESLLGSRQRIGDGIAGKVAEDWQPLLLGEVLDKERFRGFKEKALPVTSAMVVPIILRDDLVGILNITSRMKGQNYIQEDLEATQIFAEILAVCIRHTQQTDWMRETIQRLSGTPGAPDDPSRRSA